MEKNGVGLRVHTLGDYAPDMPAVKSVHPTPSFLRKLVCLVIYDSSYTSILGDI